ncbi:MULTISPECIES: hypothetical protein [Streptomyces]|uniref:hypothetical protein n=1 Tax=Streptomyces TaxID=1883 RepID=UPI00159F19FD|nr:MULTISPECIES: hypothetical protein [Streptomyces]
MSLRPVDSGEVAGRRAGRTRAAGAVTHPALEHADGTVTSEEFLDRRLRRPG